MVKNTRFDRLQFSSRLRKLIEENHELSISELGRRIGHKTGTAVSALLSNSQSGRNDLRMSTFVKICREIAEAYQGDFNVSDIILFLLGVGCHQSIKERSNKNSNDGTLRLVSNE